MVDTTNAADVLVLVGEGCTIDRDDDAINRCVDVRLAFSADAPA